jgi:hypothetical protein
MRSAYSWGSYSKSRPDAKEATDMGLTKRRDSYYVEFRVLDNGKTLTLAQKGCGQLKRWKVRSGNRTVAKQHEAMIQTELMKGLVISDQARPISDWKRLNVYGHTKNVNMP